MRPPHQNQSEVIATRSRVEEIFFKGQSAFENEYDKLAEIIHVLRDKILARPAWTFEGTFKDYDVDDTVLRLLKLLIGGRKPNATKNDVIRKSAEILYQIVEQMILTDRQVKF